MYTYLLSEDHTGSAPEGTGSVRQVFVATSYSSASGYQKGTCVGTTHR